MLVRPIALFQQFATLEDMTVPEFENGELEKLAQMVARGFEAVDKRFDEVDARFKMVDGRFDSLKGDIDQRFAAVHADIRSLRENAERLEAKMDVGFESVREDIDALAADHFPVSAQIELKKRVERIEDRAGLPHTLKAASA